jgi:uncharacterized damage-inducible protein DinB
MTNREFHLQCRKNETNAFHRVLNALPQGRWDYTPHEKSQSATRIVWTLVGETQVLNGLIDKGEFSFDAPPEVPPAQLIEQFGQAWDALLKKIEGMSEADWDKPGRFLMNGEVRMQMPVSGFLWLFFFDAIHHRGQLSTYIRPMGGKVPSIYGPSGDDPGMLSASHKRLE